MNPNAPKGGEMSIWGFGSFDSMHPYSTKGRAGRLSSIFFETLLEGNADEPDSAYGLLASSMEYPEDRTEVIFNLHPEARFSDGSPLTADDVVFSYEILRDKGLPSFRAVIEKEVESATALSKHRVKFVFKDGIEVEVFLYDDTEEETLIPLKFLPRTNLIINDMLIDQDNIDMPEIEIDADPSYVEYYLDLNLDKEIPSTDICVGVEKLKAQDIQIGIEVDCPDLETVDYDIYGTRVGDADLEICE